LILVSLLQLIGLAISKEYYNILAIDGGGIRGIIPGVILQKIELYAYEYATFKGYTFPKYSGIENKMALKDLFDMMAGTSTGSILASALACPDPDDMKRPKFFADDALAIYTTRGVDIFKKQGLRTTQYFLFIVLFAVLNSVLGYFIGRYLFESSKTKRVLNDMRKHFKERGSSYAEMRESAKHKQIIETSEIVEG
jgi:hypothetical protein